MLRRFNKWHFCIATGLLLFIWFVYSHHSTAQKFYSDTKIFFDRVSSVSAQFNTKCDDEGECNFDEDDDDSEDNNNFEADLYALRKSVNALPLDWAIGTLLPPPLRLTIKSNQTVDLDWSDEDVNDTILANHVIFESKSGNSTLKLAVEFASSAGPASTVLRCNNRNTFQLATSLSLKPVITFRCEAVNASQSSNDACIVRFVNLSADLTRYGQCQTK